jgi:drug/metabolite transporter (DMT)-like permease
MRLKADLALFLISIIWGSAFVAQRVAGQLGSVYFFNGIRYMVAGLVILPVAVRSLRSTPRGNISSAISSSQFKWMALAGLLLFLASALQQMGIVYTTAGNAGFITSLYVVLVPVVLFLFWRERLHWLSTMAVGIAVLGAFLLSTAGRFDFRMGDVLEFVGALFWALHVIVVGKFTRMFEPATFSVGQLVVCGLFNLGVGAFIEPRLPLNWLLAGAILYTSLFSLGLCYTLQIWAQRHTPPADAALILSLESVFAVLTGWWLLGERLTGIQVLGCVLIFMAVLFSQFKYWASSTIDQPILPEDR